MSFTHFREICKFFLRFSIISAEDKLRWFSRLRFVVYIIVFILVAATIFIRYYYQGKHMSVQKLQMRHWLRGPASIW